MRLGSSFCSAGPRANHTIRKLPPELDRAQKVASLPMRMGGLGLPSGGRCTRAACWASWADAIPMNSQRNPTVANSVVQNLSGAAAPEEDCLEQFHEYAQTLVREGCRWRPTWSELRTGIRTPDDLVDGNTVGHWFSFVTDASYCKLTSLFSALPSSRAHLRSHLGGTQASRWRAAPEFTNQKYLQNAGVVSMERSSGKESHAHRSHDSTRFPRGRGRSVCPTECLPQDRNVNVRAQDSRQIEVLVQDLPFIAALGWLWTSLCAARSVALAKLTRIADHDGVVLLQARQDEEATYPEPASSGRCKLVVPAIETGGRWSEGTVQTLAHSKA